ncbi:hypothetical protein J2T09_003107 [Neorhizobium huautlense]|uniref:DUF3147 family protein n=1 Tax=Neorhizobium huautlense TaxID=67774 RepID=A0ABT9PVU1_9HYPH|nr:hypothetical protein [Neorhizobium huautlense]MDP9838340.1 hypothetical protein [Neorhizobium huautlense]
MNKTRFFVEFGAGMAAYVIMLIGSLLLVAGGTVTGAWATVVSLLPTLPALGVAIAVMRQIRASDELQRRIQLEALSLAFAGTALITFSYGFLENVGYPKLSMFYVWPLMAVLWIIGGILSSRRFR